MFGLKENDINDITKVLNQFPEVEEAYIFGSRAKGNYKNGSDVDIALKGKQLSYETILELSGILNEDSLMPYRFEILNYHTIKSKELVDHIDRVGVIVYKNNLSRD